MEKKLNKKEIVSKQVEGFKQKLKDEQVLNNILQMEIEILREEISKHHLKVNALNDENLLLKKEVKYWQNKYEHSTWELRGYEKAFSIKLIFTNLKKRLCQMKKNKELTA